MDLARRVGREQAHALDDGVCRERIVRVVANVIERGAVGPFDQMDVRFVESDFRQLVVGAQAMEPTGLGMKQLQAGVVGPACGRDEADLGRNPARRGCDRERIERFGDDLRRQTGDRQQNAAGELGQRIGWFLGHDKWAVMSDERILA